MRGTEDIHKKLAIVHLVEATDIHKEHIIEHRRKQTLVHLVEAIVFSFN